MLSAATALAQSSHQFPFAESGATGIGNLGRHSARGPGFANGNVSVFRDLGAMNHVNWW